MRWLVRTLGALLVLVLLGLGLLALVPADRVAKAASDEFTRLTGRALTFAGDVSPRFWPVLGVTTGPVEIANADWSDQGPMFRAESLVIEINASALLGGEVRVLGLRAVRPEILLERSATGQANWVFGGGGAAGEVSAATPGVGVAYTIDAARIDGGALRYIDHQSGTTLAADGIDATLAIPDFTGPATLSASGTVSGHPVALTAEAGVFSALTEGRVVPLVLTLAPGGAKIGFQGRAGWQPLVAEGRLDADLTDLAALAGLLGSAAPDLPQGLGADRLAVTGDLTLDGSGAVYLRGAKIVADGNTLSGDLDLAPGDARPKLTAQLRAGPLSLPGRAASGGATGAAGWSDAALDVSALSALDAEVSLTAPSVALPGVTLGAVRTLITLDRARAVFDLREVAAYGGKITGEFVVNGRGGLSVGGDLSVSGLGVQPLLTDLAAMDRLTATASGRIKFLGVGDSMAALMAGLQGEGALTLGQGELRGLDIGGMLRTLDTGYVGEGQTTVFDGLSGTFAIAGGVLSNADLRLTAPYLTATGSGRVDLGARRLDYRLRPTALAGADGSGGVMVPLLITGPWADLSYRLDLESIAREKMEAEARAVEDRLRAEAAAAEAAAKAALEARLAEEGVVPLPGETLEDAARRRAEEVLLEEALRLLE